MSEETESHDYSKDIDHIVNELNSHKNHTEDRLAELARELKEILEEAKRESSSQVDEVRESVGKVLDWINKEEQKREAENKVKSSKQTIVAPPSDTTITQDGATQQPSGATPGSEKKKSFWKRLY